MSSILLATYMLIYQLHPISAQWQFHLLRGIGMIVLIITVLYAEIHYTLYKMVTFPSVRSVGRMIFPVSLCKQSLHLFHLLVVLLMKNKAYTIYFVLGKDIYFPRNLKHGNFFTTCSKSGKTRDEFLDQNPWRKRRA